jgi:hypothetical protein
VQAGLLYVKLTVLAQVRVQKITFMYAVMHVHITYYQGISCQLNNNKFLITECTNILSGLLRRQLFKFSVKNRLTHFKCLGINFLSFFK